MFKKIFLTLKYFREENNGDNMRGQKVPLSLLYMQGTRSNSTSYLILFLFYLEMWLKFEWKGSV